MKNWQISLCAGLAIVGTASTGGALADPATDTPAAAPAPAAAAAPAAPAAPAASPMTTPAMSFTLSANPAPTSFDFPQFGKIYITGAVSGMALFQSNPVPGDHTAWGDMSNAQVFIQKTDGLFQFYVQAGAYSLPSLGTSYIKATQLDGETYGFVPNAYVKLAPSSEFNIIAGKLPTLLGEETTFTFQNMNIARGLLWNQENVVSRGIQANYSKGPLTFSIALTDGFYSNRFNWITGLVSWAFNPRDSLTFAGGGNVDHTNVSTFASPLLYNNSEVYNLIFTHNQGPFTISPYFQVTYVPSDVKVGIPVNTSTISGALLMKYNITPAFSVAARGEYISASSGGGQVNLLYGPGSSAYSLTLTPTYQWRIYYVRGELSYVQATNSTPGFRFGPDGLNNNQVRGMLETGVLF